MDNEYGPDIIEIEDDEGNTFNLERVGDMDYNGSSFAAFLDADMDENDPDYGLIILRSEIDEKGFEVFESIDDEDELQDVYEHFMVLLTEDEEEEK